MSDHKKNYWILQIHLQRQSHCWEVVNHENKRAENIVINGAKKIKLDKIKFKSPKAHSLGKKLSKIKLNRRENKFANNQFDSNANHNTSNLNSARSKGNTANEPKEAKMSLKLVKHDYTLKSGEAKLRFSSKVKDKVAQKPNLLTKNPLKVLKKIPPEREKATIDTSAFSIPIDRVCKYNNFLKLSGRTKQSSDSGSNFMVRKNSNVSRKINREINQSRGNKTHLIFFDQQHSGKIHDDKSKTSNFNFSGPVNVKQDINSMPFGIKNLNASQKVSITRDSNKSQQLIPDTNSTLDYTAAWISSNIGAGIQNAGNKKVVLENIANPKTAKHSPRNVLIRKQKKSRESNYHPSGSKQSSNWSKSVNPSKPSIENEYSVKNTSNSNCSKFGSSSASNPSNNETDSGNVKHLRKHNKSEEKHLEATHREMKAILQLEEQLQLASSGIAHNVSNNSWSLWWLGCLFWLKWYINRDCLKIDLGWIVKLILQYFWEGFVD